MKKNLLSTTILSAALIATSAAKAGDAYTHGAVIDASTKISEGRQIAEFNYMQPFFASENSLPILDFKFKADNHSSKEINLGLAYRQNLDDAAIIGAYTYFDHRQTGGDLAVNGLTVGAELLSKYFDARANFYLPKTKSKKTGNSNKKTIKIEGSSIFSTLDGNSQESSFSGYDVEIGTPLFSFSDELNEKFGTKVYAARYSFTAKGLKPITGLRFRVTQDLFKSYIGNDSYNLYANAETQNDKVRKRQNFFGLGLKVSFNDAKNKYKKKSGLSHRMMETIIRDVDIVTTAETTQGSSSEFYDQNGNNISRLIYVAPGNHNRGEGTEANPYSLDQARAMTLTNSIIVGTTNEAGVALLPGDLTDLNHRSNNHVLNGAPTILNTRGANPISISLMDNGVNLVVRSDSANAVNFNGTEAPLSKNTEVSITKPLRNALRLVKGVNAFRAAALNARPITLEPAVTPATAPVAPTTAPAARALPADLLAQIQGVAPTIATAPAAVPAVITPAPTGLLAQIINAQTKLRPTPTPATAAVPVAPTIATAPAAVPAVITPAPTGLLAQIQNALSNLRPITPPIIPGPPEVNHCAVLCLPKPPAPVVPAPAAEEVAAPVVPAPVAEEVTLADTLIGKTLGGQDSSEPAAEEVAAPVVPEPVAEEVPLADTLIGKALGGQDSPEPAADEDVNLAEFDVAMEKQNTEKPQLSLDALLNQKAVSINPGKDFIDRLKERAQAEEKRRKEDEEAQARKDAEERNREIPKLDNATGGLLTDITSTLGSLKSKEEADARDKSRLERQELATSQDKMFRRLLTQKTSALRSNASSDSDSSSTISGLR